MLKPLVLSIAFGGMLASTVHAIDVTSCGQTLHPGDVGVLQNDITCDSGTGVELENGAVLDLGGHTLTIQNASYTAVECLARCSVLGAGQLRRAGAGPSGGGILSYGKGRVTVTGVAFDGFIIAIQASFARVTLTNTTIENGFLGVDGRTLDVDGVTIAALADVGSTCITVLTGRIRGEDLALSGCDTGIQVGRAVDLTRLTWSGGDIGVVARKRIRLVDSSVTGASIVDVATGRLPRLIGTTCDHSIRLDSSGIMTSESWGVCTSD